MVYSRGNHSIDNGTNILVNVVNCFQNGIFPWEITA